MSRIDSILNTIGISKKSDFLFDFQDVSWKQNVPFRLHKGLKDINPNCFLVQKDKVIALFFDFTQENHHVDKTSLFEKIWNLGGVPAVFIVEETTTDIYNGFSFDC